MKTGYFISLYVLALYVSVCVCVIAPMQDFLRNVD